MHSSIGLHHHRHSTCILSWRLGHKHQLTRCLFPFSCTPLIPPISLLCDVWSGLSVSSHLVLPHLHQASSNHSCLCTFKQSILMHLYFDNSLLCHCKPTTLSCQTNWVLQFLQSGYLRKLELVPFLSWFVDLFWLSRRHPLRHSVVTVTVGVSSKSGSTAPSRLVTSYSFLGSTVDIVIYTGHISAYFPFEPMFNAWHGKIFPLCLVLRVVVGAIFMHSLLTLLVSVLLLIIPRWQSARILPFCQKIGCHHILGFLSPLLLSLPL